MEKAACGVCGESRQKTRRCRALLVFIGRPTADTDAEFARITAALTRRGFLGAGALAGIGLLTACGTSSGESAEAAADEAPAAEAAVEEAPAAEAAADETTEA